MFITKSLLLPKKFIITRSLLQKARAKEKNLSEIYKKRGKNQGRNSTTKWILPSGT